MSHCSNRDLANDVNATGPKATRAIMVFSSYLNKVLPMKTQKRDLAPRAYNRGYEAGISGRSRENCPYQSSQIRQDWQNGWRDGRSDHWAGNIRHPDMLSSINL